MTKKAALTETDTRSLLIAIISILGAEREEALAFVENIAAPRIKRIHDEFSRYISPL